MLSDALVGAVAGSAAAVTSVFAFYPLEVLRVHLQTSGVDDGGGGGGGGAVVVESFGWRRFVRIFRKKVLNRGAALRLLHTQLTSFLFYYLYRYMLKRYGKARGAVTNIISTTVASMVTALLVGVPLDGIILRTQVGAGNEQGAVVSTASSSPPSSLWASVAALYQGVTPALLLCLNPAIHFTCYDYLKLRVLNAAMASNRLKQLTWADIDNGVLTSAQSFVIGLVAKGVATLVCYPLLRAKVDMMTERPIGGTGEASREEAGAEIGGGGGQDASSSDAHRLLRTLYLIVRIQGLAGLYRGISVHIVHTSLRSAFSMALRERITSILGNLSSSPSFN